MTKIYHKVFAVSELDRERDESLTMRMSALGFIEPKHLDIPELYHDEKSWILARKELHKINNYKVSKSPDNTLSQVSRQAARFCPLTGNSLLQKTDKLV